MCVCVCMCVWVPVVRCLGVDVQVFMTDSSEIITSGKLWREVIF